jgi:hypothetical protein
MGNNELIEAAARAAQQQPQQVPMRAIPMEIFPSQVSIGRTPTGEYILKLDQFPFEFVVHVPDEVRRLIVKGFSGGVELPR